MGRYTTDVMHFALMLFHWSFHRGRLPVIIHNIRIPTDVGSGTSRQDPPTPPVRDFVLVSVVRSCGHPPSLGAESASNREMELNKIAVSLLRHRTSQTQLEENWLAYEQYQGFMEYGLSFVCLGFHLTSPWNAFVALALFGFTFL